MNHASQSGRLRHALEQAEARLAIPQPARTRVLLELHADLEDLFALYREQGLPVEAAEERALVSLDLSPTALAGLAAVHANPVRRMLDRLSAQARGRIERAALALVMLSAAGLLLPLVLGGRIFLDAGPLLWPALALCLAALAAGAIKLYQLHIVQDHTPRRVRRHLHTPLALAATQVGCGFAGMYGHFLAAWLRSRSAPGETTLHLTRALLASAGLLSLALLGALISAVIWFLAANKAAAIERHEAALRFPGRDAPGTVSTVSTAPSR